MAIDYEGARELLDDALAKAEKALLRKSPPEVLDAVRGNLDVIFRSRTQAYREALLGCTLARISDRKLDVRLPYIEQGAAAFNGRTLDEKVVNPFLHDNRIPSSRGPYLSVFRRQVRFDTGTRAGLRDRVGYDSFLSMLGHLRGLSRRSDLLALLLYQVYKFAELREAASVQVSRLQRISMEQYKSLMTDLLDTPSGGRFPVYLVASAFSAIKDFFGLDWVVSVQGINVADVQSGERGDITIRSGGRVVLAAEVTERTVDKSRVVATFNTKIVTTGIEDYLFFVQPGRLAPDAMAQARQYFSQGHEVNFVEIRDWVTASLATMGRRGRELFGQALVQCVESSDTPAVLKVRWNTLLTAIIGQ